MTRFKSILQTKISYPFPSKRGKRSLSYTFFDYEESNPWGISAIITLIVVIPYHLQHINTVY